MDRFTAECLGCGQTRTVEPRATGDCARCGYVGWAATGDLTEASRRVLRERPPERRKLRAVA